MKLFCKNILPSVLMLSLMIGGWSQFATAQDTNAPAAAPGVMPAFITAGALDPAGKVPVLNGVPGAGVNNLDIALPLTLLTHGTSYFYIVALQDRNFTGTCVVSFKLTQVQAGKTVILDSGTIKSFKSTPGQQWAWAAVGKAIPNSPGLATLTGSVKYGTTTTSVNLAVVLQ